MTDEIKDVVAEQAQAILKGLALDADLTHSKWKEGKLAFDSFQTLSNQIREKQVETLRILASVAVEESGRWDKILDR